MPRLMSTVTRARIALTLAAAAAGLPGCYTEGGSMMSLDRFTYVSTPSQPKSITLIDTRTFESIWSVDIPVGQQIALQFYRDSKDALNADGKPADPMRPDVMRWEMMAAGRAFGELNSSIPVPPSFARRLEMKLRPAPEFPDPNAPLPMHAPVRRPGYADESQPEFNKSAPVPPAAEAPAPAAPPPAEPAPAPAAEPAEPPVDLPPQ